jgi:hypothetical protein
MAELKYKCELRIKDPDISKLKMMLEAIRDHFGDTTMNFYETRIMVVETDSERAMQLVEILNVNNLQKKRRSPRRKEAAEPAGSQE